VQKVVLEFLAEKSIVINLASETIDARCIDSIYIYIYIYV
jgi:hypothetical protein